ncbi:UNVERIFIED_CONTAM: hypothetical protein Sangu_2705900 [Sesamum angustifolium]|uniref:Uncharacterized protein n=1 Tax=Sesamum angustifolium TaxID=2727405 RepID=A0AAW2IYQ9_9LAMI
MKEFSTRAGPKGGRGGLHLEAPPRAQLVTSRHHLEHRPQRARGSASSPATNLEAVPRARFSPRGGFKLEAPRALTSRHCLELKAPKAGLVT